MTVLIYRHLVLIRSGETPDYDNLDKVLSFFSPEKQNTPCVVSVTHCDKSDDAEVAVLCCEVQALLAQHNIVAPIVSIDPRDPESAGSALYIFNAISNQN